MTTNKAITMTKTQMRFFSKPRTMDEIRKDLFKGDDWAANTFQNDHILACNLWLTTDHKLVHLKDGDKIEVLCHNSKENKENWLPGIYEAKVNSIDRPFRINCQLSTGVKIPAAAPECIRPLR